MSAVAPGELTAHLLGMSSTPGPQGKAGGGTNVSYTRQVSNIKKGIRNNKNATGALLFPPGATTCTLCGRPLIARFLWRFYSEEDEASSEYVAGQYMMCQHCKGTPVEGHQGGAR